MRRSSRSRASAWTRSCSAPSSNRAARLLEAGPAREQVDDALDHLQDRFTERYYGPLFGALQQRYRHTAQEGVKRLLKKELKGLGDAERAAIETWSEVLARRFAHIPCLGLRGLLHDGPDGSHRGLLERPRARVRRRAARGAERRRTAPRDDVMSERATLRLGTRGSDLARTQSDTVADALRAAGYDVELTIIKTAGDRDHDARRSARSARKACSCARSSRRSSSGASSSPCTRSRTCRRSRPTSS